MKEAERNKKRDLDTLAGIIRGPGWYATPPAERVESLLRRGLIKRRKGHLRPTLKGRLVALLFGKE